MEKNKVLTLASYLLILLGLVMVYLGGFYGPKIILPPIVTGLGFFVLAWALTALKK